MNAFRGSLPARRPTPTRKPKKKWALHKADLKVDFKDHCAYCDSFDGFRHTFFEVDHFVPKDLILKNGWSISLVEYSNLVYSCKFCNNNKLNNWPSNSPTIFNRRNKGFVDPCDRNFDSHFYRLKDGKIMWNTRLGKWMYFNAFKFDERAPGIKLLWNLNRIRKSILSLEKQKKKYKTTSTKYKSIDKKLTEFKKDYFPAHQELINYYNTI